MARDLTNGTKSEIEASCLSPVVLVEMFFTGGTLRLWTGYGTLTWNGHDFTGSGLLMGFSGFEENADLQAAATKFTLTGVPVSILSLALAEDYQNRKISCYFAVLDQQGALIDSPYLIFSGKMDVMEAQDSGATCTIALNAESDLVDLRVVRSRQYTAEDQKTYFPNDRGFDYVAKIEDLEISWGVGVES